MKQVVWKFPLDGRPEQTILMPPNAQILCVQMQHQGAQGGIACLWAQVDPTDLARYPRHFVIVGTGEPLPETVSLWYVGTFQTQGGVFVWHVFETRA
jgi:hypothetical protein